MYCIKSLRISELIELLHTNESRKELLRLFGISCPTREMEKIMCEGLEARLVSILKHQGDIECKQIMP